MQTNPVNPGSHVFFPNTRRTTFIVASLVTPQSVLSSPIGIASCAQEHVL